MAALSLVLSQGRWNTPSLHTQTRGGAPEEASVSTRAVLGLVRGLPPPHSCRPSNHEEGLESQGDH